MSVCVNSAHLLHACTCWGLARQPTDGSANPLRVDGGTGLQLATTIFQEQHSTILGDEGGGID